MQRTIRIANFLVSFFLVLSTYGQPDIEWQRVLGGSSYEEAVIQQTTDGGYIMAGYTYSNDGYVSGHHGGAGDMWVVKLNAVGDTIWTKCLGGTGHDSAYSIQQTMDGGYIVVGWTGSNDGDASGWHVGYTGSGSPSLDALVVKLDGSGDVQWQKCLGGSGNDYAQSVQQTTDGGYIVAGFTGSDDGDVSGWHVGYSESGSPSLDVWVVKLDAVGDTIWTKCLGGTGYDSANSIQQTTDGGYIVAGSTGSNDGDVNGFHGGDEFGGDFWVVKLDATGDTIWTKCLGGSGNDSATAIQETADGGYIMAGFTYSNDGDVTSNRGSGDMWAVKLDVRGDTIWTKCLGGSEDDWALSIQQSTDGGYIVAGWTVSNDGDVSGTQGSSDAWVMKLDGSGDLQWQKCLGGAEGDAALSIEETADGGYIMAGYTADESGWSDAWVVKLGPDEVGIAEANPVRLSIAPNPTNGILAINFAQHAQVRHLTLLDATGRVALSQPIANTTGTVSADLSTHDSGVYFVQVRFADDMQAVQRVVKE